MCVYAEKRSLDLYLTAGLNNSGQYYFFSPRVSIIESRFVYLSRDANVIENRQFPIFQFNLKFFGLIQKTKYIEDVKQENNSKLTK